jgi:Putative addiction module component
MNITAQLAQLSITEKISTMEYLWDDLCRHADEIAPPAWHGEVLAQRAQSVAEGDATFQDWETEKSRIRDALK